MASLQVLMHAELDHAPLPEQTTARVLALVHWFAQRLHASMPWHCQDQPAWPVTGIGNDCTLQADNGLAPRLGSRYTS